MSEAAFHRRPDDFPRTASGAAGTPSEHVPVGHDHLSGFRSRLLQYADRDLRHLHRQGCFRPDAGDPVAAARDWHYHLLALQQRHDSHGGMVAEHADRGSGFFLWWSATIVLGVLFLAGTVYEWNDLITHDGLTISRNLFGTTYYTLVGFHALHVTAGVILMSIILALAARASDYGKSFGRRPADVVVLALCGRCLGGGFHGRLSGREVRRS